MRSKFPGIDPFLEDQGYWPDFHHTFLSCCRDALYERMPEEYEARIDERFSLFEAEYEKPKLIEPDVAIVRRSEGRSPAVSSASPTAGPLVLEPVMVPVTMTVIAKERQTWIEVRRLPERELVTVIELLSPTNKGGHGRREYIDRRNAILDQPVHLVELDFLLGGRRLPMGGELPPGDFYAVVTRADRPHGSEVYAWSIRQPLPLIPIPLKAPDPDVPLDLSAVFATAYERGRYARSVRYASPLGLPIEPGDREWADEVAKGADCPQ
jgi:Protein of unknown function (DUF4058)